jgi:PAS domain S-box-containing protein
MEEALNDPSNSTENQVRLGTAHRNAMRLLKLVNTLLDFSRLEAGRVQAVFRQTDICDLTADLSSSFRSIVESAGLKFNISCSKISRPVFVDTTMWERIVFNLLSNAFKFTFEGEISVILEEGDNKIELIVKDTGTGIPEQELPKLFSRFHRIENARGRTHEGSGIGLAMVSELVKLHGGTVKVESTPGSGTSFIISIPTGKDHLPSSNLADKEAKKTVTLNSLPNVEEELGIYLRPSDPSVSIPENKSKPGKKEKILLADDNADMREYMVRLLGTNYDIRAVADGMEALKAIQEDEPCLVLSDIMMPNLDGLGLLKKLRANEKTRTIPVIFISARAGEEAKIEGIEAGADDYLVKPFTAKELIARVQTIISLSKLRKQAEETIKTERERLYQIFMQAPAMIAITRGPELVYELANDFYLKVVGKTKDIVGKSVFDVFPEIKGEAIEEILRNVYKTGERYIGNELLVRLDTDNDGIPEDNYFNFVYEPYRDATGKVLGILNHAIKVTEQVQNRKKIEESEDRFRTMAEGTEVLIAVGDTTSNVTYFNKAWTDLTGRPMEDLLNFGWVDLVHPDDREGYVNIYLTAFEKRIPFRGEFRVLNKEGNYRWLLAMGPPRFNPDGSFAGYISSCFDITEHKLAEKSLVEKNKQLIRINNDLDNFIYTASHDLKAPMSNIEGLLYTLQDTIQSGNDRISQETDMLFQLMETSIDRFKTTILDLTEITKVQKAQDEDVEEINISEMVEDVRLSIHDKIIKSEAVIKTDFSTINKLKFSKKNLKSILYNLLSNAIKYRDKNRASEIFIKTEKTEDHIILIFEDNGLGVSSQNLTKMFSMFKRFHDHVEGTGIGLYIVKRIIDNSGGKIEVESEVGRGTIFKIYLTQ